MNRDPLAGMVGHVDGSFHLLECVDLAVGTGARDVRGEHLDDVYPCTIDLFANDAHHLRNALRSAPLGLA